MPHPTEPGRYRVAILRSRLVVERASIDLDLTAADLANLPKHEAQICENIDVLRRPAWAPHPMPAAATEYEIESLLPLVEEA